MTKCFVVQTKKNNSILFVVNNFDDIKEKIKNHYEKYFFSSNTNGSIKLNEVILLKENTSKEYKVICHYNVRDNPQISSNYYKVIESDIF